MQVTKDAKVQLWEKIRINITVEEQYDLHSSKNHFRASSDKYSYYYFNNFFFNALTYQTQYFQIHLLPSSQLHSDSHLKLYLLKYLL